jgi:hypothetical protein
MRCSHAASASRTARTLTIYLGEVGEAADVSACLVWPGTYGTLAHGTICVGDEARLGLPLRLTASTVLVPVEADDDF